MMQKPGKFNEVTNPGTAICVICGRRRQAANMERRHSGNDICRDCYDMAGDENAVMDGLMTEDEFFTRYGKHSEDFS